MEMIKFIKKLLLKRNIKLDNRFQYVKSPTFLWNTKTKKAPAIDRKRPEFERRLLHDIIMTDPDVERKNVFSIQLDKDFTYEDFLNTYNYHYIVFYLYGNNIFHPMQKKDDILGYYVWPPGFTKTVFGLKQQKYVKSHKNIRVYIEEDIKRKRKLKLQKINKL